ncbi:glycosyltransferase [Niabella ginsengisoli]|uniref:Glycosyltransferase n=1 Tax=Niabella ginsengisoli TaxID=522298 RepID=A0ABS9SK36_9BACT|nr:glycosyltransferase [Niabella ginsengisoli]MCH5598724.1 glycosyltransferase [Niabella ginsengisoli]
MRGGGAERVMSVLCNKLAERGHDVWLATDISLPMAYQLDEKVKIYSRKINRTNNKLINAFKHAKNINKIVKDVKPDIIISFIWALNAIVILATLGMSIPLIASEHSTFKIKKLFINILFVII